MRPLNSNQLSGELDRLGLRTIIRLRWIAVVGQTLTLLIVYFGLDFQLPIELCLLIIAISIGLNIFLTYSYPASLRLKPSFAFILLSYDLCQLTALLFLTGGIENPFVILMVVPVIVSASTQPSFMTMVLGIIAVSCISFLAVFSMPLPWYTDIVFTIPNLYKLGVWSALVSAIVFTGVYARRIARESSQMSNALAATEMVLAREQKLSALDGLAAAAAHELGTPLSTISVVAKELQRSVSAQDPIAEDIHLLKLQSDRCREILQRLTDHDGESDVMHTNISLTHLIQEVIEEYSVFDKIVNVTAGPAPKTAHHYQTEPKLYRNPGMLYGLGNIVENAVDFAQSRVDVSATWNDTEIRLQITDDGSGVSPVVLERLGEPYITSRERDTSSRSNHQGMGLGYFIAKTLLERTGANLEIRNRNDGTTGAVVDIVWQRAGIEIGPKSKRSRS